MARKSRKSKPAQRSRATPPADASVRERGSLWMAPLWYVVALSLVVATPTLTGTYGHNYGYSPDLHMASVIQVGCLLMLGLFLLSQMNNSVFPLTRSPVMQPAILLLAWATLSMLWATNHYEGGIKLLDWMGAVLGGLLVAYTLSRESQIKIMLRFWVTVGAVLLFIGFAQALFDVEWVDQHAKPAMVFNNKNMAAQYMLLIFAISAGVGIYFREIWFKLFAIGVAVCAAVFIVLSDTRGSILALMAQLALLGFFFLRDMWGMSNRARLQALQALAALGVIVVAAIIFVPEVRAAFDRAVWRMEYLINNILAFEGEHRFNIWANSMAMIGDHLLIGVGVGNWMVHYPYYHFMVRHDTEMSPQVQHINAHQDFLEMTSELGMIGLALILWMGVRAVMLTWQMSRPAERLPHRWLMICCLAGMLGMSINSFGSFPFQQPAPVLGFMLFAGVIDNYWRRAAMQRGDFRPFAIRRLALPGAVVAFVAMVLVTSVHQRWYNSEVAFRKATIASRNGDDYQMLREGRNALKYAPNRGRMYNFVGMAHLRRGDYEQASHAFESVLDRYPYMMHTLRNAAIAYHRNGEGQKALEMLHVLLKVRPGGYNNMLIGQQYQDLGNYEKASQHYNLAMMMEPPPPAIYLKSMRNFLDRYEKFKVHRAAGAAAPEKS